MKLIFYIIFYIVTFSILFIYFTKEKKVVAFIDNLSDRITDRLNLETINLNKNLKTFYLFIYLLGTIFFIFKLDFTPNEVLPIKNITLYITIILNITVFISFFFKRNYFDYLAIINIILLFFGTSMFGVEDKYFTFLNIFSLINSILIILFYFKEQIKVKLRKIYNGLFLIILVVIIHGYYIGNYAIPTGSMETTILVGDRIFSDNISYNFTNPKLGDIISFKEALDNTTMYTKRITGLPGQMFKIENNTIFLDGNNSNLNRNYTIDGLLKYFQKAEIYIPKKGDSVKLAYLLEVDLSSSEGIKIISTDDFKKNNIDPSDYKYIFGIWNRNTLDQVSNNVKSYTNKRYTFILADVNNANRLMLPILDFKYDLSTMTKLLNNENILLNDDYYMAMGDNTENSNDSRFFGYVKKSRIKGKLLFRWYPLNRMGFIKDEK